MELGNTHGASKSGRETLKRWKSAEPFLLGGKKIIKNIQPCDCCQMGVDYFFSQFLAEFGDGTFTRFERMQRAEAESDREVEPRGVSALGEEVCEGGHGRT